MKSFRKIGLLALALSAVACGLPDEWDNTPYTPHPVTPEPEEPGVVEFTATVPTKTSLDEESGSVTWVAGDEVRFVWNGGSAVAAAKSAGQETKFKVKVAEGIDELYAVYPASVKTTFVDGQLTLAFPKELVGTAYADADISVSRSVLTDGAWNTTLVFKKAASYVKVGVVDESVTSLDLNAPNSALAGILPVSIDANGEIVCGTPAETSSTLSMTVPAPGVYWFPVLPNANIEGGMSVTLHKGETETEALTTDTELTVLARGEMLSFSQPEVFTGKFYVSPAGAGSKTGLSVLSPMSADAFKAMVTDPARIEEFNGKIFSFSGNSFSFGDDYLIFDYPDYQGEVHIILEGVAS